MDQRSDDIRNDIEQTRASLDRKLDTLEHRARQTFDLKHQVEQHPFVMFGAAVATGYILGNMGNMGDGATRYQPASGRVYGGAYQSPGQRTGTTRGSHVQAGSSLRGQFDEELDMIKTAAITTVTSLLTDVVKEVMPSMGKRLDQMKEQRRLSGESRTHGEQPHEASYRGYQPPGNGSEEPTIERPRIPTQADMQQLGDVSKH